MKSFVLASFLLLLTTIMYVGKYQGEIKKNASKDTEIKNLTDSIKTINEEKKHLRKYFTISLKMKTVMSNCNKCKKNKFILTD